MNRLYHASQLAALLSLLSCADAPDLSPSPGALLAVTLDVASLPADGRSLARVRVRALEPTTLRAPVVLRTSEGTWLEANDPRSPWVATATLEANGQAVRVLQAGTRVADAHIEVEHAGHVVRISLPIEPTPLCHVDPALRTPDAAEPRDFAFVELDADVFGCDGGRPSDGTTAHLEVAAMKAAPGLLASQEDVEIVPAALPLDGQARATFSIVLRRNIESATLRLRVVPPGAAKEEEVLERMVTVESPPLP